MSQSSIPSRAALKEQARELRQAQDANGTPISHAQSLEQLAKRYGLRNWNTLAAMAQAVPPQYVYQVGMTLRGRYLGQPFEGTLLRWSQNEDNEQDTNLTIQLSEPLNVTPEASFEVLRRRLHMRVDRAGRTYEETSNGAPHLQLDAQ